MVCKHKAGTLKYSVGSTAAIHLALHDSHTGVGGSQINTDDIAPYGCVDGRTGTAWKHRRFESGMAFTTNSNACACAQRQC